ncbi:hypothetical protein CBR_g27923 [Chara braunii]|uniref:Reverse transcriptase domain-containing protein n=1 Tax=Chara braunii TaxID=69332 RepID=A0A388L8U5_CHABU|nr:hypothetical protein CBR_g27923 [Chara braunii]|eukprot:GBG78698.1 hypothetical protein CBR_g27923 [Chara braunii]
MTGSLLGMTGQLANESIAEYQQRFETQLALIAAEEQRQLAAKAAQLQGDEASAAEKLRLQAEADAEVQARRKEAQDLLQRHEASSIDRLKFWHFEPNGDDPTPEEKHKEFLSKLVTRLLYTCNYQRSELENQYQDLTQQHQELAKLRRTVQSHEDATRALNAQMLDLEQAVPGPAVGASSSASSNRQLEERIDHVVAMLGDISAFTEPATISQRFELLDSKSATADRPQPQQQLGEAIQDADVSDLYKKVSWEHMTKEWKKRFIVDDAPALAVNRIFTMTQGSTSTRDWLTEWQKIAAVPDLELAFTHLRREFYNRSCAALSQALGDREQYSTFAEIIGKAREIIKTNRAAAHEKSTWQPTYVEKVRIGPRRQHFAAVQSDNGDNRAATPASSDGDQVAVVQPRSNNKSRNNGKAKSASQAGNGQPVQVPWVKFGLIEAGYKDYVVHLVPPLDQPLRVQQYIACTVSLPSATDSAASPQSIARDSTSWSRLEELDPLRFTNFQWMPVPSTGRLPKPHYNVLIAQLRDYLHTAVPTPLMDAGVEVVDLHAYIVKIDREFKTQPYDDIDAPLLYVRIQIGEATCSALIDCGASCNYISQDFMVRAGLGPRVRRKSQPTQVTLADGHTHKSIDRYIDAVPVYFAPHASEAVPFDILDTKFDMILGMSWLRSEDHPVNFFHRTVHIRDRNGVLVPCTVPLPHPSISCHVVSAASMRASIIRDDSERRTRTCDCASIIASAPALSHASTIFSSDWAAPSFSPSWTLKQDITNSRFARRIVTKPRLRRYGHFEWLVMIFGLKNAPATFQAAMTTEFRHMLDRYVHIYLDDILVYSRSLEEHVEHLRTVLERLRQAKYKANRDKCEFARQELEYLGHYVTPQGIRPLADKIEALQVWPEPTNTTDVRSFMGLAGYYQRFINGYSRIAAPMTRLQSPKAPFVFDDDARRSFQALKTAMLMAPVLSIYDPTLPTRVTPDALQGRRSYSRSSWLSSDGGTSSLGIVGSHGLQTTIH